MEILKSLILGIVEGVTEFLPISSTGHLILAGNLISFTGERAKVFEIFIQLGAILAVVWLYHAKLISVIREITMPKAKAFIVKIFLAFLPSALIGILVHSYIKYYLFNPTTVAIALIAGGIAIILIEKAVTTGNIQDIDDLIKGIRYLEAGDIPVFMIGFTAAFASAIIVIKIFLGYIAKHDFTPFGYYRIIFGIAALLYP